MCDPVSLGVGLVGGLVASKVLSPKVPTASAASNPDPAAERAAAEADAAQKANAQLAADNRRRREQGSLLAKGAPQPTLGDSTTSADGLSPIGSVTPTLTTRNMVAKSAATLLSKGAPTPTFAGGGGGGGSRANMAAY